MRCDGGERQPWHGPGVSEARSQHRPAGGVYQETSGNHREKDCRESRKTEAGIVIIKNLTRWPGLAGAGPLLTIPKFISTGILICNNPITQRRKK